MNISALIPIYILVLIGLALVKIGYLPKEVVRPSNLLVIKLFVPVLIFLAIFQISQAGNFNTKFILGYGFASLCVMGLLLFVLKAVFGFDLARASLLSLGAVGSNSIFIGYPIVLLMFSELADASMGWALIVENLLLIPLALFLYDAFREGSRTPLELFATFFKNPIFIAIVMGLALPLLTSKIWAPLEQALNMMRLATAGLALILVGGMLAGSKLGGNLAAVFTVTFGKLIVHPLLVLTVFLAIGVSEDILTVGVIYASVSCFSVYANFCETEGEGQFGASVFFLSTLLAPATITGWLVIVDNL